MQSIVEPCPEVPPSLPMQFSSECGTTDIQLTFGTESCIFHVNNLTLRAFGAAGGGGGASSC